MKHTSTIKSKFWLGGTGKEVLDRYGLDTHHVALYLITGPMSSLDGIYWLPLHILAKHTGLSETKARECLQNLDEVDFCRYDEKTQIVWVLNMAKINLGSLENRADNRVKSALAHLEALPETPLINEFRAVYGITEAPSEGYPEAPSEGYREGIPEAPPMPKPIGYLNNPDADFEKNPDSRAKKSGGAV